MRAICVNCLKPIYLGTGICIGEPAWGHEHSKSRGCDNGTDKEATPYRCGACGCFYGPSADSKEAVCGCNPEGA